jgi:hypothetical protein
MRIDRSRTGMCRESDWSRRPEIKEKPERAPGSQVGLLSFIVTFYLVHAG